MTGGDEAAETAKFISIFDKFFDLMNVQSFSGGRKSRKPFRHPYLSADDFRLAVCCNNVMLCYDLLVFINLVAGGSVSRIHDKVGTVCRI